MFNEYPKTRQPLPDEYQAIYKKHFVENRSGSTNASSVTSKMESWMHKQVAKDISSLGESVSTLELGAGNLNHLPYEPNVKNCDVIEPSRQLIDSSPLKSKIGNYYEDIFHIDGQQKYKRIISIAVLEHLTDLPRIIAKCGLLLKETGSFRAGIPNEGTVLWKTGYRLTTGLEFRLRYRLNYDILMQHEHVNTADDISEVLEYFFNTVTCRVFGISRGFAFYRFYDCHEPDKNKCANYLKTDII